MSQLTPSSLVIDTSKLQQMSIDGPTLKIVMQRSSPKLFPLRRLIRIHILGIPEIGMSALIYCAERQIFVAFFDTSGKFKCRLLPAAGLSSFVDHWFEHVEFDKKVNQLYGEWLLHQEMHILSKLGVNTGANVHRKNLVYETLRGFCRQKLGRAGLKSALEWLDGFLCFHLDQVIEGFGFIQERSRLKLLQDIKPIITIILLYSLAGRLQQVNTLEISAKNMTELYQNQAERIEFATRRMLTLLVNRLESIV